MQPRPGHAVHVAERRQHQGELLAERLHHANRGQLGKRPHQRRDRHALQQRFPHRRVVQQRRRYGFPRQVVRADQRRRLRPRAGPAKHRRGARQGWQRRTLRAAAHPIEQRRAGRLGRVRVREPQQVAMRPAAALAVLDDLVGEPVQRLAAVPRPHRPAQRPAPAARALHEPGELEQVCAGPGHARQGGQGHAPGGEVVRRCRQGEREQGRAVFRRAAGLADCGDARHGARAIGRDRAQHRRGVAARERTLAGVVAAALRPQDQEAVEPRPVIDGKAVPAGRVRHGAEDGQRLGRSCGGASREKVEIAGHSPPRVEVTRRACVGEGRYSVRPDASGFGAANQVTLGLQPAGGMSECDVMRGSAVSAAANRVGEIGGRWRIWRFAVVQVTSCQPPSFKQPGGHGIADDNCCSAN